MAHNSQDRAIKYRTAITSFIAANRDLKGSQMTVEDWDAIILISERLFIFRCATSERPRTSRPMLSSTHSTFRGLQKKLKEKLAALPEETDPEPVQGLTDARRKLSDYYYKYDQSPFYIWAARAFSFSYIPIHLTQFSS
jgi:hypothetical protein